MIGVCYLINDVTVLSMDQRECSEIPEDPERLIKLSHRNQEVNINTQEVENK